jgi:hypothetical protein
VLKFPFARSNRGEQMEASEEIGPVGSRDGDKLQDCGAGAWRLHVFTADVDARSGILPRRDRRHNSVLVRRDVQPRLASRFRK